MVSHRVIVRPMKYRDVKQMKGWGKHIDPKFLHYNFPYQRPLDLFLWFVLKNNQVTKRLFGGFVNGRLVGYVVLKHIRWWKREGEMGISVNPDLLEMGLGQQLVAGFTRVVFESLPIDRITLRTAHFNKRAIAVYKKVGFQELTRETEPFESQYFASKCYDEAPEFFSWEGTVLMTTYIKMEILKIL